MIALGSNVTIRPEWRDRPSDPEIIYACIDTPEHGRVSIQPLTWPYGSIAPIETVEVRMLTEVMQ